MDRACSERASVNDFSRRTILHAASDSRPYHAQYNMRSSDCGMHGQVGAARFVRSLATRAASGLRPHAPPLLKALTSGVQAERSNTVRKAYAGAAALVRGRNHEHVGV